ncbi:FUSC family protein [Bradyrhizobium sp. CB1650]|uniref:FUSC family protein n=1 Tax=Bradyrhizobium sp. CB1650 TaxID=3039153 RepID=UPI002435128F|nr:FUSC family protein [Bradyrhizobium sp. CB1650]WGD50325.1 FUSC family protein [Bradyrhizobium sp. CB1650]
MIVRSRLSSWKLAYSLNIGIVCAISYWIMTYALASMVGKESDLLGGMWSAVATLFVFRESQDSSVSAGASRLVATGVSFALCLPYLWVFPFTIPGLAALIGIGTLAMMLLGRQDDIVTTGITTVVVMVVAAISPADAWQQPILRLIDTVVGVVIGVGGKWVASYLYIRTVGKKRSP